jgi:hypothetical protein
MVKPIHSHMQHPTDLNTAPPPACTVSLSFKLLLQQLPAPSAVGRGLPKALQLRLLSADADVRQAAEADAKRVPSKTAAATAAASKSADLKRGLGLGSQSSREG